MHPDSMRLMRDLRATHLAYVKPEMKVLDDGGFHKSPDKCYRQLFPGTSYVVADIVPHRSVDVVKVPPFTLPFGDQVFDLVVSGQMLEHCQNPFKAVAEMKRVLKVGSCIAVIVPSAGRRHDKQDGWRFMDDAFKFIAAEVGGFQTLCDFICPDGTVEGRGAHWRDHVWCARRVG